MQPSGVAKFTSHQTVNYRTRTRNQTLTEEHVACAQAPNATAQVFLLTQTSRTQNPYRIHIIFLYRIGM